jgi:6-phosphogluconolactonase
MRKHWVYGFVWLYLLIVGGCGSGSHSIVLPPPAPPPPTVQEVTVTVQPATVSLSVGTTQQFTTIVTNTSNTAVSWQVGGVTGGNATLGTISSSGLYTAPAVPAQTQIEIKAISAAEATAYGTAAVTLTSPPKPPFIYVSSGPDDTIQIFSVHSGIPQPKSTISVGSGTNPVALAMHPTGKFLYSLNRGSNDVSLFVINRDTGDLTFSGSIATPDGPYAMIFSSSGNFVYVSCDNAAAVAAFSVDSNSGALSPVSGSPYPLGGKPQGMATSPDGNFLYVADSSNQIIGLAISPSDGTLTAIAGSPFSAGAGVGSIVTASGYETDFAYAANRDSGTITTYTLDRSSGALTSIGDVSSGGNSPELFSKPVGEFLLGVNSGSDNLFSFELGGELFAYGPPVGTGAQPIPGGFLPNDFYYPWGYILNRDPATSAASIAVYYVFYDGASEAAIANVPTQSNNPTGFAITP